MITLQGQVQTPTDIASPSAHDVQASTPATMVSLSRVGVTGVEKVIRVKTDGGEHRGDEDAGAAHSAFSMSPDSCSGSVVGA